LLPRDASIIRLRKKKPRAAMLAGLSDF